MYCRFGFPEPAVADVGVQPGARYVAISGLSFLSTVMLVWLMKLSPCGMLAMTCATELTLVFTPATVCWMIGRSYCETPPWRYHVAPLSGDCANMMLELVCQFDVARQVQLISRLLVDV